TVFLNSDIISSGGVSKEYIEKEISLNRIEIERRVSLYRKGKKLPPLKDKTIILVDDGVATGATIKSAIAAIRAEHPMELVVALPVSPPQTAMELKKIADKLVCLMTPDDFFAVGAHYGDFRQITDEEVVRLLAGEQEKSH
ncbi:MAG TPA: phosphoribosyltransferase family protein, partial [Thermodesulfobacteriota bacterium]|nr:phosphoribosyltransferase family protein [Thermodesulfobacteriota bacterium]